MQGKTVDYIILNCFSTIFWPFPTLSKRTCKDEVIAINLPPPSLVLFSHDYTIFSLTAVIANEEELEQIVVQKKTN